MTANLHARLLAHGIAVVGDIDLPAPAAHAHLRPRKLRSPAASLRRALTARSARPQPTTPAT